VSPGHTGRGSELGLRQSLRNAKPSQISGERSSQICGACGGSLSLLRSAVWTNDARLSAEVAMGQLPIESPAVQRQRGFAHAGRDWCPSVLPFPRNDPQKTTGREAPLCRQHLKPGKRRGSTRSTAIAFADFGRYETISARLWNIKLPHGFCDCVRRVGGLDGAKLFELRAHDFDPPERHCLAPRLPGQAHLHRLLFPVRSGIGAGPPALYTDHLRRERLH
jgi:hypothetical protein